MSAGSRIRPGATADAHSVTRGPLFELLLRDLHAMACLQTARDYGPEGAYLAAGFVRNRYWDSLYPGERRSDRFPASDIDVVYFDEKNTDTEQEAVFEQALKSRMPEDDWQVRNQARMHHFGGHLPFQDIAHALVHWSETATAIGVRLNTSGTLECVAPFGVTDLYEHRLRITPMVARHDPAAFQRRIAMKKWRQRWPNIVILGR